MPWILPVLLRIAVANGLAQVIIKRVTGAPSRGQRFFLQFLFALAIVTVFGLATHQLVWRLLVPVIILMGVASGFAAACQWRAIDISLSRTSLFTFWDDIIAMTLSLALLGEVRVLNPGIGLGVAMSLSAVIAYAAWSYRARRKGSDAVPLRFFLYVGTYSIIWGVAVFLMKYLGTAGVPIGTFLAAWYFGATISAGILLATRPQERGTQLLSGRQIAETLLLATTVAGSLALTYWAYQLAPQNIVQPYFLIGEMVLPTIIGLTVFREHRMLAPWEKFLFALAILGGIIIGISYR
jgi:hypothetical protein